MSNSFVNKSFLFTGKLTHMKRKKAEAKVVALGGKVVSSATKTLSVLVATSETIAKKKVEELNATGANIQFWTEDRFMTELEKIDAEETKANSNVDTKAQKSVVKHSKFEDMRPFIIEIETLKKNVEFECEINSYNCNAEDIEYEILCSDSKTGEYELFQGDAAFSHIFKQQGKYKISFRGNLPGLLIQDRNSYHIIDVCQWGDIGWLNMFEMFINCRYFNISADDQPDLSRVTSLELMFCNADKMNAPLEKWDVSNVTNMESMFRDASAFNQPLEKWDVSNVIYMNKMFSGASTFNKPLEKWDVSNVRDMEDIFEGAIAMDNLPSWLKHNKGKGK